jgi:hypothetical protein
MLEEAVAAYERGVELEPHDPDVALRDVLGAADLTDGSG